MVGNGQMLGECGEYGCRPWRGKCSSVRLFSVHHTGGAISGSNATRAGKAGLKVMVHRHVAMFGRGQNQNLVMAKRRRIIHGRLFRVLHLRRRSAGSGGHLCHLPVRHGCVGSGERYVKQAFVLYVIEVPVMQTRMLSARAKVM